jgi:hypothetical protein
MIVRILAYLHRTSVAELMAFQILQDASLYMRHEFCEQSTLEAASVEVLVEVKARATNWFL